MDNSKNEIIASLIPQAVLLPITKESLASIIDLNGQKMIKINSFPFNVGRESRISESDRGIFVKLRILSSNSRPNNDVYLVNTTSNLEISKEHFLIDKKENKYFIKDRNSTLGTKVNNVEIGKNQTNKHFELNDGDIINIGSSSSEFKFKFFVLK